MSSSHCCSGAATDDELRLRLEDGSFVRDRVTDIWERDGYVGLTVDGEQNIEYEVTVQAGDQMGEVSTAEIHEPGSPKRTYLGRLVGVLNLTDHSGAPDHHRDERAVLVG